MAAGAVPIIVSLAGAAAQYAASERADRQRQSGINAIADEQEQFGKKNRSLVTDLSKQYDPTKRAQVIEDIAGTKAQAIGDTITKAQAQAPDNGYKGTQTSAYSTAKATTAANEAQRRVDITKLLSKVLAPAQARVQEGLATANEAGQNNTLLTNLRGSTGALQNQVAGVQPDAGLVAAGGLAQGVGAGLAYTDYQKKLAGLKGLFAPSGGAGSAATDIAV